MVSWLVLEFFYYYNVPVWDFLSSNKVLRALLKLTIFQIHVKVYWILILVSRLALAASRFS